ncbi:MAG: class I SAM-dependent methyltransferase [Bacteroidales bacterium]|jgi:predicted O-methyltransferase YrrM|nr:class I SAM-dependent methyltransferase [Bacteroidales bacterium]
MMFFKIFAYIHYQCKRKRWVHSAFVYDFIISVLKQKKFTNNRIHIEKIGKQLLKIQQKSEVRDSQVNRKYGLVASQRNRSRKRLCNSVKVGCILHNLVRHYHLCSIVELGTSLGIDTVCLAKATPNATVFTVELNPEMAEIASKVFEQLHLTNIELINTDSDAAIALFADKSKDIDLFFINSAHSCDSISRYFSFVKNHAKNNTIFILSDIYCSKEMRNVWKKIQADPNVSISIDLYAVGIVFFRKGIVKQNFTL